MWGSGGSKGRGQATRPGKGAKAWLSAGKWHGGRCSACLGGRPVWVGVSVVCGVLLFTWAGKADLHLPSLTTGHVTTCQTTTNGTQARHRTTTRLGTRQRHQTQGGRQGDTRPVGTRRLQRARWGTTHRHNKAHTINPGQARLHKARGGARAGNTRLGTHTQYKGNVVAQPSPQIKGKGAR